MIPLILGYCCVILTPNLCEITSIKTIDTPIEPFYNWADINRCSLVCNYMRIIEQNLTLSYLRLICVNFVSPQQQPTLPTNTYLALEAKHAQMRWHPSSFSHMAWNEQRIAIELVVISTTPPGLWLSSGYEIHYIHNDGKYSGCHGKHIIIIIFKIIPSNFHVIRTRWLSRSRDANRLARSSVSLHYY